MIWLKSDYKNKNLKLILNFKIKISLTKFFFRNATRGNHRDGDLFPRGVSEPSLPAHVNVIRLFLTSCNSYRYHIKWMSICINYCVESHSYLINLWCHSDVIDVYCWCQQFSSPTTRNGLGCVVEIDQPKMEIVALRKHPCDFQIFLEGF